MDSSASSDDEFIDQLSVDNFNIIQQTTTTILETLAHIPSSPNFDWNFQDEVNPGRSNHHFHDRQILHKYDTYNPREFHLAFR